MSERLTREKIDFLSEADAAGNCDWQNAHFTESVGLSAPQLGHLMMGDSHLPVVIAVEGSGSVGTSAGPTLLDQW